VLNKIQLLIAGTHSEIIPFGDLIAMDTLAVQLTLPLAGCVGNFHPRVSAPCRAHKEKKQPGLKKRAVRKT
jgi:hypothetical protein